MLYSRDVQYIFLMHYFINSNQGFVCKALKIRYNVAIENITVTSSQTAAWLMMDCKNLRI
jgi:hypothetical protein